MSVMEDQWARSQGSFTGEFRGGAVAMVFGDGNTMPMSPTALVSVGAPWGLGASGPNRPR